MSYNTPKINTLYNKYNYFDLLPDDILANIFYLYLKSKNVFYYINPAYISKKSYSIFNLLYKQFYFTQFRDTDELSMYYFLINIKYNTKNIYFVKSEKHNIKFAKLYFINQKSKFILLNGSENMTLTHHKFLYSPIFYNNPFYDIKNLINFKFLDN